MADKYDSVHKMINGLQNGQAVRFDAVGDDMEVVLILPEKIDELNHLEGVCHIVCNQFRDNSAEYMNDLENKCFPPGTIQNHSLVFHIIRWGDILWSVATIPKEGLAEAESLATPYGFKLRNTVPFVLRIGPSVIQASLNLSKMHEVPNAEWFPVRTNTYTVEAK